MTFNVNLFNTFTITKLSPLSDNLKLGCLRQQLFSFCHSRTSGNPDCVPVKTGNNTIKIWIPASAGMTQALRNFEFPICLCRQVHYMRTSDAKKQTPPLMGRARGG